MASIRLGRWIAKKLARHGMALTASTVGRLAHGSDPRVRVMTYHRFGDSTRDPFCVSRSAFEAQMRWLAERRLAVSLAQVESFVSGQGKLPDGAVLVTMDDGCRSVYSQALPILREYAIPAVAYVPAGVIEAGVEAEYDEPPLSWEELGRLVEGGLTIGSHAFNHRSLGRISSEEAREEAVRSRTLLEQRLGRPVRSLAYPFGTRADYSQTTRAILYQAGYTTAFTSQHGALTPGLDPLELPRVKVEGGEADWMFPLLCRGALDGWALIDRGLWRLQR